MSNKSNNEMEQIQQGLEAFLEKELDIIGSPENEKRRNSGGRYDQESGQAGRKTAPPRNGMNRPERKSDRIQVIGQDWDNEYEYDEYGEEEPYFDNGQESYESYGQVGAPGGRQSGGSQSRREEGRTGGGVTQRSRAQVHGRPQEDMDSQRTSRPRRAAQSPKKESTPRKATYQEERRYPEEEFSERKRSKKKKRSKDQEPESREDVQMAKKAPKSSKGQKKKKKSGLKKVLIVAVAVVALLGFGLYQLVGFAYGKMNYSEIASVTDLPMQEDGVVNILLIGNDSRENGDDGRSDAMILLSISSKTKTIYMTSLLRDMYVEIPGHDNNRLNAAYSFGGAELLMETVEKNFDIPVNRYMLVNFEGFANLVDTVGGIELELTSEEIEYVNGYLVEYNMLTDRPQGTDNMDPSASGLVHLNGPQALAYSRNRYLGTDFGRTDRQRKVLTAVIKKLPSVMLTNAGELMDGLLPNLTTNLTRNECFRLSLMAGKLLTYEIVADSIPQPGTYSNATIRKMAVLEIDFDANIRYLKEKLYGE